MNNEIEPLPFNRNYDFTVTLEPEQAQFVVDTMHELQNLGSLDRDDVSMYILGLILRRGLSNVSSNGENPNTQPGVIELTPKRGQVLGEFFLALANSPLSYGNESNYKHFHEVLSSSNPDAQTYYYEGAYHVQNETSGQPG